jgi:hypothetical protein
MSARAELSVPVDVDAPPDAVWRYVTDWEGQGRWMLGTRVEVTSGDGRSVGSTWRATTGAGPVGVVDTIEVAEYSEGGPWRCVVRHTGKLIRGDGVFEVVELAPGRSRFTMSELLDLPFGLLGRVGWRLVRPVARAGMVYSLRKMAAQCEAEHRGGGS